MKIMAISFIVFWSTICIAQNSWDLQQCINYAVEHSIIIEQTNISLKDAEIQEEISKKQRLPNLNGSLSATTNFGRSLDPTTNEFNTATFLSNGIGLNSNVTIYNGGRLKNQIESDQINYLAINEDKKSSIITVSVDVARAYFDVLFARDNYSNSELDLKTIQNQIKQMERLVEAGSRAQFEIYDLQAQAASSEQQLTISQNNIELALIRLKGVMNYDINSELNIATPPIDIQTHTDINSIVLDNVIQKVLENRPEINAHDLRIKAGEMDVQIAKASLLPSINAGVGINTNYSNQAKEVLGFDQELRESNVFINGDPAILGVTNTVITSTGTVPYFTQIDNNFGYGIGVTANIPIYNNYNAKGNIERRKLQLLNLQANKDQYIINLQNTIGQIVTDARAANKNLEASKKVLEAREIAFSNAQKRHELGAINSFEFISIQDQLNQSRINYTLAKYDYLFKIKLLDFYQGYPITM